MIEELTGRIEKELKNLVVPGYLPELYDPISYTLADGGKRIRPLLLMLSARIFDVSDEESIHQAMAVEIFHNFTLVHDDIMDNAPLRRGKASVYQKWNANTAILSGDVMFSLSMQEVVKCNQQSIKEVLDTFIGMTIKVCEGQQMDMNFEKNSDVSIDEYMKMIELKTAYLLAGSLKLGAILGRADKTTQENIFNFGLKSGIAFQLMDDFLDAFGTTKNFGKQIGGDILAGKKTFLHLHCLSNLFGKEREEYLDCFTSSSINAEEKIERTKKYFETTGAKEAVKKKAQDMLDDAKKSLHKIEGNRLAIEQLVFLTNQLTNREK